VQHEQALRDLLSSALSPSHLEIHNESPGHGLPASAEKHFRVVVVSSAFAGLSRVDRHRWVHQAVASELSSHIHALAVQAYTPSEWDARVAAAAATAGGDGSGSGAFESPDCLGGGKREGQF
jgi:BolA protein